MSLLLYALLMVICCILPSTSHNQNQRTFNDKDSDIKGSLAEGRTKRSLSILLRALLAKAQLKFTGRSLRVWNSRGGYSQALKDFDELDPSNTITVGSTKRGVVDGDKLVTVTSSHKNGGASIKIFDEKTEFSEIILYQASKN